MFQQHIRSILLLLNETICDIHGSCVGLVEVGVDAGH